MMSLVKKWLEDFQAYYRERDQSRVSDLMDLFHFDQNTCFLGHDLGQWFHDQEQIEAYILDQWQDAYDFNLDQAFVEVYDKMALVYTTVRVKKERDHKELFKKEVRGMLEHKDDPLVLDKLYRQVVDYVDDYGRTTYPMRFTCVLVRVDGQYRAHHVQFAYDAVMLWQHRLLKEYDALAAIKRPRLSGDQEIKDMLGVFQAAYQAKNIEKLDEFMDHFHGGTNFLALGTDADEILTSVGELREMVESDWTYWGDFTMDIEGASICRLEDEAYFLLNGIVSKENNRQAMLEGIAYYCEEEVVNADSKEDMIHGMRHMMDLHHEMNLGHWYHAPMRLSGTCKKIGGKWMFTHIQFSDYMTRPEKFYD